MRDFEIYVDGEHVWGVDSSYSTYDAVHFVAGALLCGADEVRVERVSGGSS